MPLIKGSVRIYLSISPETMYIRTKAIMLSNLERIKWKRLNINMKYEI